MKVHLVKSPEIEVEKFSKIVDLLNAVPGTIKFVHRPSDVVDYGVDEDDPDSSKLREAKSSLKPAKWNELFAVCELYREANKITHDEFVILLTDIPNERNWFSSNDARNPFNAFVHSAGWEHFIAADSSFPAAYEVLAWVLRKHMFLKPSELWELVHMDPIGCMNDFCADKKQIILKLRTADICPACLEKLKANMKSQRDIQHALEIMDSLRLKMLFSQNFRQNVPLSKLEINAKGQIRLPDFGNIEIKLRPLEKALYLLYLEYPKGIYRKSLQENEYKKRLIALYGRYTRSDSGYLKSIEFLVDPLRNSFSEKVSRIKSVFESALGEQLAKNYYIQGEVATRRKISLDRSLVTFKEVAKK